MNNLTEQQKEQLISHATPQSYNDGGFSFGPVSRREAHELYEIFNLLAVGHFASLTDKSRSNDSSGPLMVHVNHRQADKLLNTLSELTGKSLDMLTDGKYSTPVASHSYPTYVNPDSTVLDVFSRKPKKDKKPKLIANGFDFSKLLK